MLAFSGTRVRWTDKELEEIKLYAAKYLKEKKTPSRKVCLAYIKKSKETGGQLQRRSSALIVKKISAINVKARRENDSAVLLKSLCWKLI